MLWGNASYYILDWWRDLSFSLWKGEDRKMNHQDSKRAYMEVEDLEIESRKTNSTTYLLKWLLDPYPWIQ